MQLGKGGGGGAQAAGVCHTTRYTHVGTCEDNLGQYMSTLVMYMSTLLYGDKGY